MRCKHCGSTLLIGPQGDRYCPTCQWHEGDEVKERTVRDLMTVACAIRDVLRLTPPDREDTE